MTIIIKIILILPLFLVVTFISFAQNDTIPIDTVKNWKRSFKTGLNVNQASFSDNWKGGGVNSIALGSFLNVKTQYETKKVTFTNEIDFQYGILKNKDQSARKTIDRIFLDSKYGFKLSPTWSMFVSSNFISQFDLGYRYSDSLGKEKQEVISKFFSPAYLTASLGFEYNPVSYFWMRIGLATFRQTVVGDTTLYLSEPKNYGVPLGKRIRNEAAFQYTASIDKEIMKNINLKARFVAFANYEMLDAIDTRLDLVLTAKVNKFINVNIATAALYDQDMDYKIQHSQTLALGVLFNFSEFPKE